MSFPYIGNQNTSKPFRDLIDCITNLQVRVQALDTHRQAMIQEFENDTFVGPLSVRSDAASGMITLPAGHSVLQGYLIDLSWSGGGRSGCLAGVIDGQNVPFSGGVGTDLPAQSTTITVVHYLSVAKVYQFNTGDGTTLTEQQAQGAFNEIASCYGAAFNAIMQLASRFKQ